MDSLTTFLDGANTPLFDNSLRETALALLLAFVLGQLVAWVYARTHSGLSYSRSFTQSLVAITMLVSLVMFVVGNSLVTAFGLLGALAIIRFRNVLKDTRDTVFIFLALAIGIACGTQRYTIAIFGTLALLGVLAYLDWTAFGTFGGFDGYVNLQAMGPAPDPRWREVLDRHCRRTEAVAQRFGPVGEPTEFVFRVGLRDRTRGAELLGELRSVEGVVEASLSLRDELAEI